MLRGLPTIFGSARALLGYNKAMYTTIYNANAAATGEVTFTLARFAEKIIKIPTSQTDVTKIQVDFSASGEIRVYGRVDMTADPEIAATIDDGAVYTIVGKYNHIWLDVQSLTGTASISLENVNRGF